MFKTDPCISLKPFFIFKTCVPLFLFCGIAKRKSEHKKFWKRSGIVPRRRTSASVTVGCRFAAAWQARRHFDSIPWHTMCFKSTNVTVQTPVPASNINSSLHFPSSLLHFQNLCPAFSFFAETQKEKANIKSFVKG